MNPPDPADDLQLAATAVIAKDETLLAQALQAELRRAWPGLVVAGTAPDGDSAVELALARLPDLLLLDIRMPGRSGLEAAQAVVEDWPAGRPLPLIVFITAYDQYALQAFEASAVDYLLKPVQPARLAAACRRLRGLLAGGRSAAAPAAADPGERLLGQLRHLLGAPQAGSEPLLSVIQASNGAVVHMVPVDEVLYFEAADKYVRVITAQQEHLIRTSLRELQPQLDPQRFWQIHRGTIVRCDAVATAVRDESGKLTLSLRGHADKLTVSRLYAHLFKGM